MKKVLLFVLAAFCCFATNAKTNYGLTLDKKLSLEEAIASTDGFAIVHNGRVFCKTADGLRVVNSSEINETACWFKLEAAEGALAGNYYIHLYDNKAASQGYVNASAWSHSYLTGNNSGEKTDGAAWTIAAAGEKIYTIRNVGAAEGNYNTAATDKDPAKDYTSMGYLCDITSGYWANHATWQNETGDQWEFYSIKQAAVSHTEFTFKKITFEEAQNSENTVVLMNSEGKVLNAPWGTWNDGVQVHAQSDFDEKSYQIQIGNEEGGYTIKINESGNYNRYLQASVWGHSFINSTYGDKKGNDGKNGAVWTIAEISEGKYSIKSLGVTEGSIRDNSAQGYLYVAGDGSVKIDSDSPYAWEFYKITSMKTVPEGTWTCPEGETDITTLDWVNKGQDCTNDFGTDKGNIYGTDAGTDKGTKSISYVDVTNYGAVKVYGAKGSAVRLFINREENEASNNFTYHSGTIGEDGVVTIYLANVLAAHPDAEYIHLNGVKAGPSWNSKATVYGITLVEKETPYTIATTAGKIGTIVLDYPAYVEGATLYEVVNFDATTGLELAEVNSVSMVGGTPYIYVATANEVACSRMGSSVAHGDFDCTKGNVGNGLVGCYSEVSPTKSEWFGYIRSSYIINNNQLRQIGQGNITIPANRCFFDPSKYDSESSASGAKTITIPTEEATAIKNVNASLEGGKIYDMNGREVKSMKKGGIYVVGGMKISVK